jgi:hypothetical protein
MPLTQIFQSLPNIAQQIDRLARCDGDVLVATLTCRLAVARPTLVVVTTP